MSLDSKNKGFRDKRTTVVRLKSLLQIKIVTSLVLSAVFLSVVFLSVGCAPRIPEMLNNRSLKSPISSQLMIHVDEVASEIRWNAPVPVSSDTPVRLRSDIARHLERAFNAGQSFNSSDGYHPARFLLEVHNIADSNMMIFIPCLFYLTFVGCPHRSLSADITLSVEYRGKIFSTSATGKAYFNFYNQMFYPHFPEVSPVAAALRDAVRQLAPKLRASTRANRASSSSSMMISDSSTWATTPTSRWPHVRSERVHAPQER